MKNTIKSVNGYCPEFKKEKTVSIEYMKVKSGTKSPGLLACKLNCDYEDECQSAQFTLCPIFEENRVIKL